MYLTVSLNGYRPTSGFPNCLCLSVSHGGGLESGGASHTLLIFDLLFHPARLALSNVTGDDGWLYIS